VYTIGILNFAFPDLGPDRYKREIQLMDKATKEIFYDKLTFIYLEMPNFRKEEQELESHFDKWMYVLKNLSRLQDRPAALQEKIFERLFSAAEIAKLTPLEMKTYDESLKTLWDNYSTLETAKQEGLDRGIEEGIEKGAYLKAIAIAREMKKEGFTVAQVVRFTGLSREEIEEL
jgi:predicted transposase/invertase (TIGR01784 family)